MAFCYNTDPPTEGWNCTSLDQAGCIDAVVNNSACIFEPYVECRGGDPSCSRWTDQATCEAQQTVGAGGPQSVPCVWNGSCIAPVRCEDLTVDWCASDIQTYEWCSLSLNPVGQSTAAMHDISYKYRETLFTNLELIASTVAAIVIVFFVINLAFMGMKRHKW